MHNVFLLWHSENDFPNLYQYNLSDFILVEPQTKQFIQPWCTSALYSRLLHQVQKSKMWRFVASITSLLKYCTSLFYGPKSAFSGYHSQYCSYIYCTILISTFNKWFNSSRWGEAAPGLLVFIMIIISDKETSLWFYYSTH